MRCVLVLFCRKRGWNPQHVCLRACVGHRCLFQLLSLGSAAKGHVDGAYTKLGSVSHVQSALVVGGKVASAVSDLVGSRQTFRVALPSPLPPAP